MNALVAPSVVADPVVWAARRFLPAGGVFFDVGANVGAVSLAVLDLAGHVYAFEACPDTYWALRRNLRPHINSSATLALVGSRPRTLLQNLADSTGSTSLPAGLSIGPHRHLVERPAPVLALDDLAAERAWPDVVKIDVEGAELDVLAGATQCLSRKPVCIVEFNALCLMAFGRVNPMEAIEALRGLFPFVYRLTSEGMEPLANDYAFLCENVLRNGCVDNLVCTFKPLE